MSPTKTTSSLLLLSSLLVLTACYDENIVVGSKSDKPAKVIFDSNTDKARYSPTGDFISYTKVVKEMDVVPGVEETHDLWMMNWSGKYRFRLCPAGSYLAGPAWAPDGTQIYFASTEGISVVPSVASDAGGVPSLVVTDFAATDPDVSPDGKSLVYAINGGPIKLVDLANPATPKDLGVSGTSPRFSPDGKSLAFTSRQKINVMDIASGKVSEVANGGTNMASVDWFPDGNRLAITSDSGIEVITLGATPTHTLIQQDFGARSVDVSLDGKSLIYGIFGGKELFVMTDLK